MSCNRRAEATTAKDSKANPYAMQHASEDELIRILRGQESLVQEVYSILEEEEKKDDILRAVIRTSRKPALNSIVEADPSRIFTLADIRNTCIKYRLRFLPAGLFKGTIPVEALHAVRHIEARTGAPLEGFMIMAPAARFKLCDCDADPLLFAPLANGNYYLLHRWGRDLSPLRAVMGWPVRGWQQLVATVWLAAALISAVLPTYLLTTDQGGTWWNLNRFATFNCTFLLLSAATSFGWFAFFGQFSKNAWNSATFN